MKEEPQISIWFWCALSKPACPCLCPCDCLCNAHLLKGGTWEAWSLVWFMAIFTSHSTLGKLLWAIQLFFGGGELGVMRSLPLRQRILNVQWDQWEDACEALGTFFFLWLAWETHQRNDFSHGVMFSLLTVLFLMNLILCSVRNGTGHSRYGLIVHSRLFCPSFWALHFN